MTKQVIFGDRSLINKTASGYYRLKISQFFTVPTEKFVRLARNLSG